MLNNESEFNLKQTAVILAGGRGTRLRPYTVVLPKPLMPIGDYPILEVVIRQLANFNFTRIILAVNHQAELIKAYFGNGSKWKVKIEYSLEDEPLGTMGPLKLVNNLPSNFLVMNGDVLSDLNYKDFFEKHINEDSMFTIASHIREQKIDYGVLEVENNNKLIGFSEKPINTYLVSMGVYMLNKRVLDYIPDKQPYGFDNLMNLFLSSKKEVNVIQYRGYWLDIGRPEDYHQAIEEFDLLREKFLGER